MHDALHFPADWGFDSTFNWRYIYRLSEDLELPRPDAGWATADPPLYFALGAAVIRGFDAVLGSWDLAVPTIPLLGVAAGLGMVALAASLVRRRSPDDELRAWLAAGLLLYLPAHVHMSVMVNEEVWVALFVALGVWSVAARRGAADPTRPLRRAAAAGVAGGLAILTKLTGVLAVGSVGLAGLVEGARRRAWKQTVTWLCVLGVAAFAFGGWWFARNLAVYGWLQPFGMPAHELMFGMPPGERGVSDYAYLPAATFTDPQLLNADLLRSVWGSTYATLWFDGHRALLPRDDAGVTRLGSLTLLLGLIPTLAFAAGLLRGARRARERVGTPDLPLVVLTAVTLLGYAVYTWQNPWFAVVKATSLSALALPFAFYASEALVGWLRRGPVARWSLSLALAALATCSVVGTSFGVFFAKTELPGLEWRGEPGP